MKLLLPYAAFIQPPTSSAGLSEGPGLQAAAVLVTGLRIVTLGPVTGVVAELHPPVKIVLRVLQEVEGSVQHLES